MSDSLIMARQERGCHGRYQTKGLGAVGQDRYRRHEQRQDIFVNQASGGYRTSPADADDTDDDSNQTRCVSSIRPEVDA